tara:strand:+ start:512 stop:2689 length:2178 start_codon:yes stop_codon:yes gene_type:complete
MLNKTVYYLILIFFFLIISLITTLSTIGLETNKFNKLIANKAAETQNIDLTLNAIKFKLDLKELSLFLETNKPKVNYRNLELPTENIKVYIDFTSLIKAKFEITKVILKLGEVDLNQLEIFSSIIKPSNFKNFLVNNIKDGVLICTIEIFLNKKGKLNNYIAKGEVKNLQAELINNFIVSKGKFDFFADKEDILIKNFFGDLEDFKISNGDIKLKILDGVKLSSNFDAKTNLDEKFFIKHQKLFDKLIPASKFKSLSANLSNNISVDFDRTYKIRDYSYELSGKVEKSNLKIENSIKKNLILDEIKEIFFSDLLVKANISNNSSLINISGEYSLDSLDFLKFDLNNIFKNNFLDLKLDLDLKNNIELKLINYKKNKNEVANLFLNIEKKDDLLKIKELNFKNKKDLIQIKNLNFKKNNLTSFEEFKILTSNNDFLVQNDKKISIKGKKFDAINFLKLFDTQNDQNTFEQINSEIEIDFQNIRIPMSEKLENFKLIGEIQNGKFIKISSKGDFGGNNYLDISMKKNENSSKKYLEIYSDLPRPLLSDYEFFKGLSGGKLLFTSLIDDRKSNSKLKIENFKLINAPDVIQLLSLADLGGLADLVKGKGLSFDVLEIDMEKDKNFLKINEILALGPSMSVLMEGYSDNKSGLISLRGTLVPAKTLNNLISKIPVIGNIVIPKEVGEGLFGISFKMKGTKGKIKTSINPVRTLTPRFIQKIVDKNRAPK